MAQHLRIGSVVTTANPNPGQTLVNATVTNITDAYIEVAIPASPDPIVRVYPWSVLSYGLNVDQD